VERRLARPAGGAENGVEAPTQGLKIFDKLQIRSDCDHIFPGTKAGLSHAFLDNLIRRMDVDTAVRGFTGARWSSCQGQVKDRDAA
jgi:hypothetical protein